jgi:aminoglycoside phosphotransferase (APT) family kinase protein
LHAGEAWTFDRGSAQGYDKVVWGREPASPLPRSEVLPWAARRERALLGLRLRPAAGLTRVQVHRWTWTFEKPRYLPRTVSTLRAGAVVELSRGVVVRAIDEAARAGGVTGGLGRLAIGPTGSVTATARSADGSRRIFRAAPLDATVDPDRAAEALRRLEGLGPTVVPRLAGAGRTARVSWSTESLMPGRQPDRLSPRVLDELLDFLLSLPRADGPPMAFRDDIETLATHVPSQATELRELLARHESTITWLPAVMRHGDLWSGNVLVHRGRLSGVVDWDAWHPAGVPGTDLVHLTAMEHYRGPTFAEILTLRPWKTRAFRGAAARYWQAMGVRATDDVLDAVGIAWWATQAARSVTMEPENTPSGDWVERHILPAIAANV